MKPEVVFVGKHIYESRVVKDGYSVDDVVAQIMSGMHESCEFHANPKMNSLVSREARNDGYGNTIFDETAFECSVGYPRPELYSVIPKGDKIKPRAEEKNRNRANAVPISKSTDSTG
jgi:hypothetical protein